MDARETLVSIYRVASDRELTFLAAGFAYYAFVSLIPLVVLALVVGSIVGGEELAQELVEVAGDLLPEVGEEFVMTALTTEAGRAEASVLALAVATWGGLKVFRGLSKAFDEVYGEAGEDSLLEEFRDGVVIVLAVAVAIGLMIAVGVVLGVLAGEIPFVGAVSWLVLIVGLFAAFVPIYYVLPPISIDLTEALPGAAFAAVGWTVLQIGFQYYAANAGQYEAYGAIGAVLVFVTWLYFAGILILSGAVINVVLSRPGLVE